MRDQNVIHVVPALFGYEGIYGGAERYALELAKAMADRVQTTLISFGAKPKVAEDGPLRIEVVRNLVPYRRFRFDPFGPELLLRLSRSSIIHYHQTHTFMAGVALAAARLTGRSIFTSHLGGAGLGVHNWMNVKNWYNGHLHISDFSRKAFGHETLPNASVIGGGVDLDKFTPIENQPTRDYVLYAGRLLPHKGINYLIEAMDSNEKLILAGRPWSHATGYLTMLHNLSIGKRVDFRTDASDADLVHLYQNALCVVLPSVYETYHGDSYPISELLGQTLLEGMSCGTPGICTAVGGMTEIVEDGVSGFIVPPNNPEALAEKIRWLRSHPVEAARMGLAARRRIVEKFSWTSVVDRCFTAYGIQS